MLQQGLRASCFPSSSQLCTSHRRNDSGLDLRGYRQGCVLYGVDVVDIDDEHDEHDAKSQVESGCRIAEFPLN